jgi:spore maturation protein CgeB
MGPIGFLGADWWGSDARATAQELRRLGAVLVERHYEDFLPTRWRCTSLRVIRRIIRPLIEREYNRAVLELLQIESLEFLLVFKGMLLHPETLKQFKGRGMPVYCLYPDVSFQDHGSNIHECMPLYDCVFTTKSWHLDDPEVTGRVRKLMSVPHGFDPEVHRRLPLAPALEQIYACDASFVGAWSLKKQQLLVSLLTAMPQLKLHIWGPAWGHADARVRGCWKGRGAWGDEAAAIYRCSKINLGLLSEAGTGTRSGDLTTARTWQIPASGGFLLHEDSRELRAAFEPDVEVGVFSGAADLAERTAWWLAHDAERVSAAERAWERSQRDQYTYARAVDSILEYHRSRSAGP